MINIVTYSNLTVDQAEELYCNGYDIICNGDSKTVTYENRKQKYLKFLETLEDDPTGVKWIKGHRYKVMHESDDVFMLRQQKGIPVGIDKKCEGKRFIVIEEDVC